MGSGTGKPTFDYVIVGAGSAGCVLANRLSSDPGVRVALLEAGGRDFNPWLHIPAGYFRTIFNPSLTWQFGAGPEPHLDGRIVPWPRGRVLGGTSAINGLLYVRGQARDFDTWRQLGNAGWSYRDVLPYFIRAEDQERGADDYHGAGGPLGVSDVRMQNPLCEAYIAACVAAGIPRTADFNGANQEGVGYYQLTTRKGRRCSTAVGYLNPVRSRTNLAIITNAEVRRYIPGGDKHDPAKPPVRLIVHDMNNLGLCFNSALQSSKAKYYVQLDSDDLLFPDAVEKLLKVYEEDDRIGMVIGSYQVFDKK